MAVRRIFGLLLGVALEVEAADAGDGHVDGQLDRVVGPGHFLGPLHLLAELFHAPAQLVRVAEEVAEGVFGHTLIIGMAWNRGGLGVSPQIAYSTATARDVADAPVAVLNQAIRTLPLPRRATLVLR